MVLLLQHNQYQSSYAYGYVPREHNIFLGHNNNNMFTWLPYVVVYRRKNVHMASLVYRRKILTTKPEIIGRIVPDKTETYVESIPANIFSRELLRPIWNYFRLRSIAQDLMKFLSCYTVLICLSFYHAQWPFLCWSIVFVKNTPSASKLCGNARSLHCTLNLLVVSTS